MALYTNSASTSDFTLNFIRFCSILVRLTFPEIVQIFNGLPHYISVFWFILGEDIHLYTKRTFLKMQNITISKQFYIILAWCFGLFLGLHIIPAVLFANNRMLLANISYERNYSFLFLVSFVYIWASHYSIRHNKMFILPILCLVKATLLGFSIFLIGCRFSSGGWLALLLFLFSDIVSACLFLWFWLQKGTGYRNDLRKNTIILCIILLAAISIDRFILTPFLYKLF